MNTFYLNELKKRFKIHNRFWRKNFSKIKPDIDKLYFKSIIKNYLPFRIAFSKTLTKIKQTKLKNEEIENYYLKNLVYYLNLYKNKSLILKPEQKARLVNIKNKTFINIVNHDAHEDPATRKKIQDINQRILEFLKKNEINKNFHHDSIFIDLIEPRISNLFLKSDFNLIQDFIDSPIGKIFNNLIPGFSIILEIQKQRELLKEQDYLKVANQIVIDQMKHITQRLIYILLSNFKSIGQYIAPPLATLTGIAFERYDTYKKCDEILNKNFNKLYIIKEEIKKQQKFDIDINNKEDIKKLLAT